MQTLRNHVLRRLRDSEYGHGGVAKCEIDECHVSLLSGTEQ